MCKFPGFYYEIEVAKGTNNLIIIQLKRTTYGTIKLPPRCNGEWNCFFNFSFHFLIISV